MGSVRVAIVGVGNCATSLIQGVEYDMPDETHLLSASTFDGSTSFTIPSIVALPASGTLIAKGTALMGTIDLQDFSLDNALEKVTGFSAQPLQLD